MKNKSLSKFVIIKELKLENGAIQNVILVNSISEIMEFNNYKDAEKVAKTFENNSDSKHKYLVKKIV